MAKEIRFVYSPSFRSWMCQHIKVTFVWTPRLNLMSLTPLA